MLNYKSMARSASKRRQALTARISSAKSELVAMEKELLVLEEVLKALPSAGLPRGSSRQGKTRKRGAKKATKKGRWRPGKPGRPPQWYIDEQKSKGTKTPKAAKAKEKRKRRASPKQLAALAKAREARMAKRNAAEVAAS